MSHQPPDPLVHLEGVTKQFGRPFWPFGSSHMPPPAVDNVSFTIEEGETFGLVGESGSGKSTLARLILNLLPATAGVIYFQGIDVQRARRAQRALVRRQAQIIFQDPYSSLNPSFSVEQILWEGLRQAPQSRGRKGEARKRMEELLSLVGLPPHFLRRRPQQLSGGQRQRVGIARALSGAPRFIVADEPTSALDVSIQAQILNLFIDLQQELRLTYLFISHDLRVVRYMCNRLAVMYRGQIVELGAARQLLQQPAHPYTSHLLSSLPTFGQRPNAPAAREQAQRSDSDVRATGCLYRARCPLAVTRCATEVPDLGHWREGRLVRCHRAGEMLPTAALPDNGA